MTVNAISETLNLFSSPLYVDEETNRETIVIYPTSAQPSVGVISFDFMTNNAFLENTFTFAADFLLRKEDQKTLLDGASKVG